MNHSMASSQLELDNKYNPKKSTIRILILDILFSIPDIVFCCMLRRWSFLIYIFLGIFVVGLLWQIWNLYLVVTDRFRKPAHRRSLRYYSHGRVLIILSILVVLLIVTYRLARASLSDHQLPDDLSWIPGGMTFFIASFYVVAVGQLIAQNLTQAKYDRNVGHWELFDGYTPLA